MKVAVTGGIGAGKSEFMRAVKELGIRTYSADEINAKLLRDKRYIEKLSAAFPLAVKDGKVDKAALREEVFSDEKKRKTLNALAHPEIRRKIEEITGDAVIEVPLLFESGMTDLFDKVIVVPPGSAKNREPLILSREKMARQKKSAMASGQHGTAIRRNTRKSISRTVFLSEKYESGIPTEN